MASLALILYLMLSLIIDPRFLAYDFRQKYSAFADSAVSVSLTVLGAPEKPTLTAISKTENASSFIELNWNATQNTLTYDIYRNSILLVSGLTDINYRDSNITKNTFYDYKVLARGLGGETFSNEVHIFSGQSTNIGNLYCKIDTINDKSFRDTPKITDQRPTFSGRTNIKNARIKITITGSKTISASTNANSNGHWSWSSTKELDYAKYKITVKALDQESDSISAKVTKYFELTNKEQPVKPIQEKIQPQKQPKQETDQETKQSPEIKEKEYLEIFAFVANPNKQVYSNDDLIFNVAINVLDKQLNKQKLTLTYTISDQNNNAFLSFSEDITIPDTNIIQKRIPISNLIPKGLFKIRVETAVNNDAITGEDNFEIKEYYIISFAGVKITLSQITQSLSWLIIIALGLSIFFFILLGLEKYLASQAKIQITEYLLSRKGFFGKRKEVQK